MGWAGRVTASSVVGEWRVVCYRVRDGLFRIEASNSYSMKRRLIGVASGPEQAELIWVRAVEGMRHGA